MNVEMTALGSVRDRPGGLCGRKATLNLNQECPRNINRFQNMCYGVSRFGLSGKLHRIIYIHISITTNE